MVGNLAAATALAAGLPPPHRVTFNLGLFQSATFVKLRPFRAPSTASTRFGILLRR